MATCAAPDAEALLGLAIQLASGREDDAAGRVRDAAAGSLAAIDRAWDLGIGYATAHPASTAARRALVVLGDAARITRSPDVPAGMTAAAD
jgi:hypothetical protein